MMQPIDHDLIRTPWLYSSVLVQVGPWSVPPGLPWSDNVGNYPRTGRYRHWWPG